MPERTSTARRLRPSPSIIISIFALVVAMSSGAYAAVTIAEKNSVVSKSIKNKNVKSADIKPSAVKKKHLASNSVDSSKIIDGQVGSSEIADGAVGSSEIADGAIGASDFSPTALGNYYTKGESDSKFAPYPKTIRGTYIIHELASGAGEITFTDIAFGVNLNAAPTPVLMPLGGPANPNCTGTAASPTAAPGFLCLYESGAVTYANPTFFKGDATPGTSPYGTTFRISSTAAGQFASIGSWAVTPAGPITAAPPAPGNASGPATALIP